MAYVVPHITNNIVWTTQLQCQCPRQCHGSSHSLTTRKPCQFTVDGTPVSIFAGCPHQLAAWSQPKHDINQSTNLLLHSTKQACLGMVQPETLFRPKCSIISSCHGSGAGPLLPGAHRNIYFTAASHGKPYRLLAVSRLHINHSIVAIPPWAV